MMTIEDLRRDGWVFEYSDETGFVGASHKDGGEMTICELRPSMQADMHNIGGAIAAMLNIWGIGKPNFG